MQSSKKIGKGFLPQDSNTVPEAPADGKLYARKDESWELIPKIGDKPVKRIPDDSYIFQKSDIGYFLMFINASLTEVTLPAGVFEEDDELEGMFNYSNVTILEGTGVTMKSPDSLTNEYEAKGVFGIKCISNNDVFVNFGHQIPV